MRLLGIIFSMILLATAPTLAATLSGKVVAVADGDTTIQISDKAYTDVDIIRLLGRASKEDADAAAQLATAYNHGWGVKQSYTEAYFWESLAEVFARKKAEEAGMKVGTERRSPKLIQNPEKNLSDEEIAQVKRRVSTWSPLDAISIVSMSAHKGSKEALSQLHTLAEGGDISSQVILGGMYFWGRSVTTDYSEAEKWYLKAAATGNIPAQQGLGRLYQRRSRDKKDLEEAYFWYSLCKQNWKPYPGCEQVFPSCPDGHDVMKTYLNSEQLSSVNKRVKEWKPAKQELKH